MIAPEGTRGQYGIWVISAVGGSLRKVMDGAWGATLSPDGSLIAFVKKRDEIWIARPNGENPRKLVTLKPGQLLQRVDWSPDGQRIAYLKHAPDEVTIETYSLAGGEPTVILSDLSLIHI